jgi:hypothetical protein
MPEPHPSGSAKGDDPWAIPDHREEITQSQDSPTTLQAAASAIPMPDREGAATQSQDDPTQLQDPPPTPSLMSIEEWLNKLRSSDRAFYNIMAMEVWSLAKSMDSIVPGFWSQFMVNRRNAMQEFVERRRHDDDSPPA